MKEVNDIIDLQKEFKHVMDLVYNHWKTNSDIESILKMAWEEGIKESSNHQYVSDGTPFNNKIAAMDFTKEFEKSNHIYVYLYHRPELLKAKYTWFNDKNKNANKFNFGNAVEILDKRIKEKFKNYHENKPLNWVSHRRKYKDEPWEYDDSEYCNSFKGHNATNNHAISGNIFPKSTSLLELTYMHEKMGTHPLFYLANAVFSHARLCNTFNISLQIYKEFDKIYEHFKQPDFKNKIIIDFDFSQITNNNFILSLSKELTPAISQEEFNKIKKDISSKQKEFNKLTEEEKNSIKKQNAEALGNMLKNAIEKSKNKLKT